MVGHDDFVVLAFLAHVDPFRLFLIVDAVCSNHIEHTFPTAQIDDFGCGDDMVRSVLLTDDTYTPKNCRK